MFEWAKSGPQDPAPALLLSTPPPLTLPLPALIPNRIARTAKSASKAAAAAAPEEEEEEPVYEVERLVGQRGSGAGLQYQVKWVGYGDVHNTWEPAKNLQKGMTKTSFAELVAGFAQ